MGELAGWWVGDLMTSLWPGENRTGDDVTSARSSWSLSFGHDCVFFCTPPPLSLSLSLSLFSHRTVVVDDNYCQDNIVLLVLPCTLSSRQRVC